MKKYIYLALSVGFLVSCDDFLDTNSPSQTDTDFVMTDPFTSRAALYNIYESWRTNGSHTGGLFYDVYAVGSDSERQPEGYPNMLGRYVPTNLYGYVDATFSKRGTSNYSISTSGTPKGAWESLYALISNTNIVINSIENSPIYSEFKDLTAPTEMSEIYGEAVAMRATCYHELIRAFGDVPHQLEAGKEPTEMTPRDVIAEYHLKKLMEVEKLMYRPGETAAIDKTFMTRTYVQGLIARIALMEGGYQTRRSDFGNDYYKDLDGNVLAFEKISEDATTQCFYGRRTDWEKFYKIADVYLSSAYLNPGPTISLQKIDPRTEDAPGRIYGNPYQYVFQQMMNGELATENVYEIPETRGVQTERPYAFGRPSSGASADAFPCKSYGQSRMHPIYYYDDFDPADLRRDVTCTVTGSVGNGSERIITFDYGTRADKGGIALNKWDENRQSNPWTISQRMSGINTPYMRFSDLILMLAEVKFVLGDVAFAKNLLEEVHQRAFGTTTSGMANIDNFINKCGSLLDAILQERKLEFGGEGIRRYDMIRTNTLGSSIRSFHQRTGDMIAGLKSKGWYEFENGNVISNYIWVKLVNPKDYGINYHLTASVDLSNLSSMEKSILYPFWRGQNDDWKKVAENNGSSVSGLTAGENTNLSIEGLFTYLDPNGVYVKELEANGYEKIPWGIKLVELENEYNNWVFNGYEDNKPPIYLIPIYPDVINKANGILVNGYGFSQQ